MTLKEWVAARGGPKRVALLLKVTEDAVRKWVLGTSSPTARLMVKTVRLSRGDLRFEDIFAARHFDKRARK
jgi:hypothetical protein